MAHTIDTGKFLVNVDNILYCDKEEYTGENQKKAHRVTIHMKDKQKVYWDKLSAEDAHSKMKWLAQKMSEIDELHHATLREISKELYWIKEYTHGIQKQLYNDIDPFPHMKIKDKINLYLRFNRGEKVFIDDLAKVVRGSRPYVRQVCLKMVDAHELEHDIHGNFWIEV